MPVDQRFHDLVEFIESVAGEGVGEKELLKLIADAYGFSLIAYLGLHFPRRTSEEPLVCFVYPESWVAHCKARNYVQYGSVIHQSLTSVLPADWAHFPLHAKKVRALFGETSELGIGAQGITFPIRGRSGEMALLSVASNLPANDWIDFKRENLANLQMLAFYIHQTILRSTKTECPVAKLSPREIECLKWAANGKTFADIADILSISERTVRFYLNIARHKLNCLNITHTVARAIIMNLIPPPR
jgi:DNA-binding CsgD family transcriptional regulator